MNTYKVDGDRLIESSVPAVVLALTAYRVYVPPEWGWFDVIDRRGHVVSVHASFDAACAQRDLLNRRAS